ncbi:MAG: acyltransferase [Selenomonas sp.]|uniref:acyltransferase family protein n=1 Tax=Selenomonas sp. TaxID=2053611 RepID=UPI0025D89DCE|nr:acyltransferase [Selenomonas sp.]MCR5757923.1 acyltransferase [Selenomonas sp.]
MKRNRLYFFDNLKWFIIWLMVVFHGAMCYMAYAPDWWYVVDKDQPVLSATIFICWADIFIMPVMFFISGYFGLMSMSRHGLRLFWRKKVSRIILPWLFGSIFIAPPVTYIILASRHANMGFWDFYGNLFWGPLYEQAQYWYLGALLALYGLLTLTVELFPRLCEQRAGRPGGRTFLYMFLVAAGSIGAISSFMHPDTWRFFAYILVLQPVRIPLYIMVFFTGAWAWRQKWFTKGGYVPGTGTWGMAFLLTGIAYLWQKFFLPELGWEAAVMTWTNAITMGAFALSSLFFLLGFFRKWLNGTGRLLSALGGTSYGVYYLHMPVLFPVAWAFVGTEMNVYLKYICVCVLTLGICYLGSRYGLSHLKSFALPNINREEGVTAGRECLR